jgi:hypothetical protein
MTPSVVLWVALAVVAVAAAVIVARNRRRRDDESGLEREWAWGLIALVHGMLEADALSLEPGLSREAVRCWAEYGRIYGIPLGPPIMHLRLHATSETMPEDHPIVGWRPGSHVIDLLAYPDVGSPERWLCGELHNVYRWHNGWPIYCEDDTDRSRDAQCAAANAVWQAIP